MTISKTQTSQQKRRRGTQSSGRTFSQVQIDMLWRKSQTAMEDTSFIGVAYKFFSKGYKNGTHILDDYGHVIAKENMVGK